MLLVLLPWRSTHLSRAEYAMATIEMPPFYATDFKMLGERWFFLPKMQGSTQTRLVLQVSPAVVLLQLWRAWVCGLHVWHVTI